MNAMDLLEKRELKELLCKGWMTHDAMWLLHCLEAFGMEKTNEINIKAVFSMSQIEINRVKKALGYSNEKIKKFDEIKQLIVQTMEIIKADFMDFTWSIPEKNVLHWKWSNGSCFAYQGIKGLGVLDTYECGIMKRIEGWMQGLEVEYELVPNITRCLMTSEDKKCEGDFILFLE